MRILVTQAVAGFNSIGDAGGGERHIHALTKYWKKQGHLISLVTNTDDMANLEYSHYDHVYKVNTLKIPFQAPMAISKNLFNYIVQRKQIKVICDKIENAMGNQIDLVIAAAPTISDLLLGSNFSKKFSARFITYFHLVAPPFLWYSRKRGSLPEVVFRWAFGFVGLLLAKLFDALPVFDHPEDLKDRGWKFKNGVLRDDDWVPSEIVDNNWIKENSICFIARNDRAKGFLDLPEIFAMVAVKIPDAKLFIGGTLNNQSLKTTFYNALRKEFHDRVKILGYLDLESKLDLLRKSKVFVFPSYEDSWSIAVMEAAANKCVPVVYNLRAYDYLGTNAVKVPVSDTHEMAEKIIKLLNDDRYRKEIADSLFSEVINYKAKDIADCQIASLERFVKIGHI